MVEIGILAQLKLKLRFQFLSSRNRDTNLNFGSSFLLSIIPLLFTSLGRSHKKRTHTHRYVSSCVSMCLNRSPCGLMCPHISPCVSICPLACLVSGQEYLMYAFIHWCIQPVTGSTRIMIGFIDRRHSDNMTGFLLIGGKKILCESVENTALYITRVVQIIAICICISSCFIGGISCMILLVYHV